MAASPRASLRSSALCRVVLILLPAFYCSWTAFRLTLRLTLFRSEINGNDGQFSRTADAWNAQLRTSFDAAKYDAIDARARSRVVESDENECFPLNSIDWLEGPRHGNSDEEGLSFGTAPEAMPSFSAISSINNLRSVLHQSLCHNQSALLSLDSSISLISEERAVHLWTARLLYLVVYEHQHRPAFPEAEARSKINTQCMQAAREKDICSFDFECPSAKFLVVSFYKNGIGANMRLGAVPALEAGIASGRVVVFVDDAATGPAFLQEPWTLASCDHRRDAQCFFRAATPCVLTANELASAYTLKKGEMRRLFRHGLVPDDRVDDRVLILHLSFRPQRQPENLRTVLHNRSTAFIERLVASDANLVSPELLYKAADAILHEEESAVPRTTKFNYYGAGSQIFHSLLLYAMRPNPGAAAKMDAILHEVIPDDFSATSALGLPIRGKHTTNSAHMNERSNEVCPTDLLTVKSPSHPTDEGSLGQVRYRKRVSIVRPIHGRGESALGNYTQRRQQRRS